MITANEVALVCTAMARREHPATVDPRVDHVLARETYLARLARENPDNARMIAKAFRARPAEFSDLTGNSPDRIESFAAIIERALALYK